MQRFIPLHSRIRGGHTWYVADVFEQTLVIECADSAEAYRVANEFNRHVKGGAPEYWPYVTKAIEARKAGEA